MIFDAFPDEHALIARLHTALFACPLLSPDAAADAAAVKAIAGFSAAAASGGDGAAAAAAPAAVVLKGGE